MVEKLDLLADYARQQLVPAQSQTARPREGRVARGQASLVAVSKSG